MKRMKYVLAMVATLALLVSCSDKLVPEVEPEGPAKNVVFTATTESAGATKTVLDGNDTDGYDVLWRDGDAITIVDAAATPNVGVYTTNSTTTTGSFTLSEGAAAVTSPFTAYYPATIYNSGTPTLPAEQTYVAGNIAGAPMLAVSDNNTLGFKNLTGIIRLNLTTSQSGIKVSSIALSATQGMSGAFNVTSDAAVISSGTAGVTLNCPGEGVTLSSTPTPFYIAVPANTYTGLSITVTTTTGALQTFTLKSDRNVVVSRSQITEISLTANNIHSEYDLTGGNVTVPAGTVATVTGSSDAYTLTLGAGASVTIQDIRCRQIITQGDATLTLIGSNVIAPIAVDRFNAIIPADNSTLTINGTGSLDCSRWTDGTGNACISNSSVNLVIEGGVLTFDTSHHRGTSAIVVNDYTQTGGEVTIRVDSNNDDGDRYPEGLYANNDVNISGGYISSMGSVAIFANRNMTISGGTVVATANGGRNYYGNSGLSAVGTLTISGGTVTASGEGGAVTGPGIGSVGTCGNIVITGGNITATGFNDYGSSGSSGIGTGSGSSGGVCGTITITSGIERLVVTKASKAQAPIGKGNANSTIGTITIDGVENPTAESFFSDLNLEVSNGGRTWTFTPATNVPTSLANMKDMINAGKDASAYLGRYVYSDGNIGTDETDAIGLVAYTGTDEIVTSINDECRILIIGLSDNDARTYYNIVEYGLGLGRAFSDVSWTEWRVPSKPQWEAIYGNNGLGGGNYSNLCGDSSAVKLASDRRYWSSTVHSHYSSGYTWYDRIWAITNGEWTYLRDDDNYSYTRAIFGY